MVEHTLGPVGRIPLGEGREYLVAGRRIAVFRLRSGRIAATDARCPHRGGPLADGIVGMETVVCPLHARRFSLVTGEDPGGGCGIATHPARIDEDGCIVVGIGDVDG